MLTRGTFKNLIFVYLFEYKLFDFIPYYSFSKTQQVLTLTALLGIGVVVILLGTKKA